MNHSLLTPHGLAITRPRFSRWWLLLSVGIGVIFLFGIQLPLKWFLASFVGSLVLAVSLITEDRKKFFLFFMILALPINMAKTFFFTPSSVFRASFGFTIYVSYLPLLALYFIWAFRRVTGKMPMPVATRGLMPFAALFVVSVVSTALISEVGASKWFAVFNLFDLAFSGLFFIYVASEIREVRELRLVLGLLIVCGLIQAIIAIGQNLTGTYLGLEFLGARKFITGYLGLLTLTRVTGTLGHPASLAGFFDLIIPISFGLLFYPLSRPLKISLALVVIIEFIGLGMTYSRGGIFWTIMASGLILLVHLCRRLGTARGAISAFALGTLFALLILVVPNPIQKGLFRTEPGTALGRLPLMQVAANVIRHHPLLGVGLNNYVPIAKKYDYTRMQITSAWDSAVHNVYLYLAGEIGLIGLFLLFCLLATVLWHLLPAVRSADPFISCVGLGVLAALLGYLIHWMTDLTSWTSDRLFWVMLGLAVALGHLAGTTRENMPGTQAVAPG